MTFNPVAALNVLECRNIIPTKNASAIDLGSQTSSINNIFIKNLINQNKPLTVNQKSLEKLSSKKILQLRIILYLLGLMNTNL